MRWLIPASKSLALAAGVTLLAAPCFADWSMFHGDPRHSGAAAIKTTNSLAWSYLTSDTLDITSPTIGPDGTIYVSNLAGSLVALFNGGNVRCPLSGLS